MTHAVAANVQDIAAALKAAAGRDSDSDEAAAPPVLGEEPSSWMSSSGAKMAAALGNLGQGSMKMLIQDTSAQLEHSVTPTARLKAERAKKRWQKAIHLAGVMTKRFSLKRPDGPTIQVGSEDACAKQAGATPPVRCTKKTPTRSPTKSRVHLSYVLSNAHAHTWILCRTRRCMSTTES